MKVLRYIVFDDDESEVIERALRGHGAVIVEDGKRGRFGGEPRYPVRIAIENLTRSRYRKESQAFGPDQLNELDGVLRRLVAGWTPESRAEWWREQGAPGGDDAVEGLAAERREQITRAQDALRIVGNARLMAGLGTVDG